MKEFDYPSQERTAAHPLFSSSFLAFLFLRFSVKWLRPEIMAQAGQGTDALQRIFTELKSRNEDSRFRAATELRELVATLHRGEALPVAIKEAPGTNILLRTTHRKVP
jgi:hypothetical protein